MDANCLDCGKPMVIEMKDDEVLKVEPDTMVGYTYGQVGGSIEDRPYR
jgi:hypothetical protein